MYNQPRWFWLVLWFLPFAAQAQDVFTLTADRLQNGQAVELDGSMRPTMIRALLSRNSMIVHGKC